MKEIRKRSASSGGQEDDTELEIALVDVADAFTTLPVAEEELGHTMAPSTRPGELLVFQALLFGYKTAPLLWSRVAAMWSRMAQSFFRGHEAQHQTYLDDSFWMLQGELHERNSNLALILTTAAVLGLKTALGKGERGPQVQWIGVRFAMVEEFVILTLPEKYTKDLVAMLRSWDKRGLAPLARTQTGGGEDIVDGRDITQDTMGSQCFLQGPAHEAGRHSKRSGRSKALCKDGHPLQGQLLQCLPA